MTIKTRLTKKMLGQEVAFRGETEIMHGLLIRLQRGIAVIEFKLSGQVYTTYIEKSKVWREW